jgi:hypothetical protein
MLASTCFTTGTNSLENYSSKKPKPVLVDLTVQNIPEDFEPVSLKKISGVKQVINATVNKSPSSKCTGRMQIRLN